MVVFSTRSGIPMIMEVAGGRIVVELNQRRRRSVINACERVVKEADE